MAMNDIVGIDLGTTNSLIAAVDAGIPYVIADAEGERLTPSVVHFPGAGAAPLVGRAAARLRVVHPAQTVYSIKRFMGRRGAEIPREEMLVTYPVRGEGAGPVGGGNPGPALHARGNFGGDFEKVEGWRRSRAGQNDPPRRHHRARLFQRRAAQRHQKSRRAGRFHRRAHRQRADRGGPGLRFGQFGGTHQNRRL